MYNTNAVDTKREQSSQNLRFEAFAAIGDSVATKPILPTPHEQYRNFNIAAVGLGVHRSEDPGLCLQRLTERLENASGVCLMIDWIPDDNRNQVHGHGHGHPHAPDASHSHGLGHHTAQEHRPTRSSDESYGGGREHAHGHVHSHPGPDDPKSDKDGE